MVEEAARTIVSGRVFSAAVVHGVRIPGTAHSNLRQRKVSTEALKIVREGVGGNVSVDVSDSSITVADSDTSADVSVFFVYVSQSALASGHAVFHFLVDSTGCFGVPLRWSVNREAVVRDTDDAGGAAIRAAVAAATVLACCLWEEMVMVAAIRWMTKAVVHRLDLDEDGIAAARIVWTEDGNAVGCVANGTLRSRSAISQVKKSGNSWHTEAHRSGFDEGVLAGQSPSVVVGDSGSVDCVSEYRNCDVQSHKIYLGVSPGVASSTVMLHASSVRQQLPFIFAWQPFQSLLADAVLLICTAPSTSTLWNW